MTMVSYVPKKGTAVVLLSTMHDDRAVDDNSVKRKQEVIQYYNQTKSGEDTMDQMVHTYTCKRRTRRWPMVLWHNVLDVATLNAYTNFTAQHPDYMGGVTNALHQGAGQRAYNATYEEAHGGHTPPPNAYYRGNGKMWVKKNKRCHHPATGGHQTGRGARSAQLPKTEKPAAGVPSAPALCARSTNMGLSFVRHVCTEMSICTVPI